MTAKIKLGEVHCFLMVAVPSLERVAPHSSVEETGAELVKN